MKQMFALALCLLFVTPAAFGASALQGWLVDEGVTGDPSAGEHRFDREIVYMTPAVATDGPGAGMRMLAMEPGWFLLRGPEGVSAGSYYVFTMNMGNIDGGTVGFQYLPAPVVVPEVTGEFGGIRLEAHSHYCAMYNRHYNEWAESPWLHGTDFYQTFTATSDAVTRVAAKLADKHAGPGTHHLLLNLNYAIYKANDGPPSTWERISPVRNRIMTGTTDPIIHVHDVNFLSHEVPLTVGETYAFRLWVGENSEADRFAVVARPKNGAGYPHGRAWNGDEPQDWDLYGYVSGGAPDTVNNFGPTDQDSPAATQSPMVGSGATLGQTFKATGSGLAAVEIFYTVGCEQNPSNRVTMALYDAPGGKRIGPARTTYTVTDLCQGRAAAFWPKGEVPLTPGETYYLEFAAEEGWALNAWTMNGNLPDSEAYVDGEEKTGVDLPVSIVEYKAAD